MGIKPSEEKSSSDIEYSSVSSVSLGEPTHFLVVDSRDDFWPSGPLACSTSMAARWGGKAPRKVMGSQLSSEVMGAFRQSQVFGEITTLTFERFLAKVDELNNICQYLVDTKNRRLVFEVHSTSETPVLWKSEVRVRCHRVGSGEARLLTLRQFLHTYHTIKAYYSAAASCGESPSSNMCASTLFTGVLGTTTTDLEECCICMEHRPEVTLPCTHSYCLRCIEQWNVSNTTCPLCREEFQSTKETWVISEAPESSEVLSEMQKALSQLPEQKSSPSAR
ncbi:RING finger protein 141-like isoform X4 [Dermacentor variabilis]|uniref:RING finger protein 141-like isoform X4 n=1 Tax=Dermacentor variabilis TaxID=34621 RepID=UPI003F5CB566